MSWATMPVGIPTPPAILGQTRDEIYGAGYYTYWVNNLTGNDGTAGNGGKGTEALPRATIPTSLTAGDVVELRGGPYTGSAWNISSSGTAIAPIIIRGPDWANRINVRRQVAITGSYVIVENIKISDNGHDQDMFVQTGNYSCGRYIEIVGTGGTAEGAGQTVQCSGAYNIFANGLIHDCGDWDSASENDMHALGTGGTGHDTWYLWNTVYYMGGDGCGNSHDGNHGSYNLFVGGNTIHDCRENCIDLKEIHDVIISENDLYNITPTDSSSDGAAIVLHYGPTTDQGPYNVWVIANHIHDCNMGIAYSDCQTDLYVVGNVIHDCDGYAVNPSRGGGYYYVYHNTIYNCGAGISQDSSSTINALEVHGNIVSLVNTSGRHLEVYSSTVAANTNASHECYYQNGGNVYIAWGSGSVNYSTVAAWIAGTSDGDNSIQQDPKFVNAAGDNFALQSDSPCINAGYDMSTIEDIFAANWSTSLLKDIAGTARPDGVWDMGAYQYSTATPGGKIAMFVG